MPNIQDLLLEKISHILNYRLRKESKQEGSSKEIVDFIRIIFLTSLLEDRKANSILPISFESISPQAKQTSLTLNKYIEKTFQINKKKSETQLLVDINNVEGLKLAVDYYLEALKIPQILEKILSIKEAELIQSKLAKPLLTSLDKHNPLPSVYINIEDSENTNIDSIHSGSGDINRIEIKQLSFTNTDVELGLHDEHRSTIDPNYIDNYLKTLIHNYEYTSWAPLPSGKKKIKLRHIYVKLNTYINVNEIEEDNEENYSDYTLTIPQALRDSDNKLLVLGDPGSGKTTLLRYLALVFAYSFKKPEPTNNLVLQELGLDETGRIPIFLSMGAFGMWLSKNGAPNAQSLVNYVEYILEREFRVLEGVPAFLQKLTDGECVLLLDGLDEISNPDMRDTVVQIIDRFVKHPKYGSNRFIISSRILGYRDTFRLDEDFLETIVRPFDVNDIRQFVNNYCIALSANKLIPNKGDLLEEDLSAFTENVPVARITAIRIMGRVLGNPALLELATNPLIITIICIVLYPKINYGGAHAAFSSKLDLIKECTIVLIENWPRMRIQHFSSGRKFNTSLERREWKDKKNHLLELIAFEMQVSGQYNLKINEISLIVKKYLKGQIDVSKQETLHYLFFDEVEGILHSKQHGELSFVHPNFREFLAANHVSQKQENFTEFYDLYIDNPSWNEVLIYALEMIAQKSSAIAAKVIRHVIGTSSSVERESRRLQTMTKVLIETKNLISSNTDLFNVAQEIEKKLNEFILNDSLRLSERVLIADLLGRHGDSKVDPYKAPKMVLIELKPAKLHQSDFKIVESFMIGKFLVTNQQFLLFTKYNPDFAPKHWLREGYPASQPTHPVVDISLNVCLEYCSWLESIYKKPFRLPTNQEWEVAAGWQPAFELFFEYPWGNNWDQKLCNSRHSGIRAKTTPVGIFAKGKSSFGLYDTSGNVWEWTSSICAENDVVIKGGSFSSSDKEQFLITHLQCYPTNGFNDQFLHRNIGFRIACNL